MEGCLSVDWQVRTIRCRCTSPALVSSARELHPLCKRRGADAHSLSSDSDTRPFQEKTSDIESTVQVLAQVLAHAVGQDGLAVRALDVACVRRSAGRLMLRCRECGCGSRKGISTDSCLLKRIVGNSFHSILDSGTEDSRQLQASASSRVGVLTPVEDDELGDAKSGVGRHLDGAEVARREALLPEDRGSVQGRVITCLHIRAPSVPFPTRTSDLGGRLTQDASEEEDVELVPVVDADLLLGLGIQEAHALERDTLLRHEGEDVLCQGRGGRGSGRGREGRGERRGRGRRERGEVDGRGRRRQLEHVLRAGARSRERS